MARNRKAEAQEPRVGVSRASRWLFGSSVLFMILGSMLGWSLTESMSCPGETLGVALMKVRVVLCAVIPSLLVLTSWSMVLFHGPVRSYRFYRALILFVLLAIPLCFNREAIMDAVEGPNRSACVVESKYSYYIGRRGGGRDHYFARSMNGKVYEVDKDLCERLQKDQRYMAIQYLHTGHLLDLESIVPGS